jgi:hypothetical protein
VQDESLGRKYAYLQLESLGREHKYLQQGTTSPKHDHTRFGSLGREHKYFQHGNPSWKYDYTRLWSLGCEHKYLHSESAATKHGNPSIPPSAQTMTAGFDRTEGIDMLDMSLEYRHDHGRTCRSIARRFNKCGHAAKPIVYRITDCWECALSHPTACDTVPCVQDHMNDELSCPSCRFWTDPRNEGVEKPNAAEAQVERSLLLDLDGEDVLEAPAIISHGGLAPESQDNAPGAAAVAAGAAPTPAPADKEEPHDEAAWNWAPEPGPPKSGIEDTLPIPKTPEQELELDVPHAEFRRVLTP